MLRSLRLRSILTAAVGVALAIPSLVAAPQKPNGDQDKQLDIQSNAGDLHVGNDADARKAGLPLYPGARLRHDEENDGRANLSLFTQALGVKLVIAKYDSDDAPGKIIDYYRERLKKYGKVIECHTREHGGSHADIDDDDRAEGRPGNAVKCEGDNRGPVTELKVGTEENQHVVSVEPDQSGSGTSFVVLYVHARGKQGDI
jgi:hypothetical protein